MVALFVYRKSAVKPALQRWGYTAPAVGAGVRRDGVIGLPQPINKYAVRQRNLSADKT